MSVPSPCPLAENRCSVCSLQSSRPVTTSSSASGGGTIAGRHRETDGRRHAGRDAARRGSGVRTHGTPRSGAGRLSWTPVWAATCCSSKRAGCDGTDVARVLAGYRRTAGRAPAADGSLPAERRERPRRSTRSPAPVTGTASTPDRRRHLAIRVMPGPATPTGGQSCDPNWGAVREDAPQGLRSALLAQPRSPHASPAPGPVARKRSGKGATGDPDPVPDPVDRWTLGRPKRPDMGTATSARGHAAGSTLAFPTTRFRASSVACGGSEARRASIKSGYRQHSCRNTLQGLSSSPRVPRAGLRARETGGGGSRETGGGGRPARFLSGTNARSGRTVQQHGT